VVALRLLARVLVDPAQRPVAESSTDSALGVWAEIGMAKIGISPSKLGIGEIKLSNACI
jgi:hypothetical protein